MNMDIADKVCYYVNSEQVYGSPHLKKERRALYRTAEEVTEF